MQLTDAISRFGESMRVEVLSIGNGEQRAVAFNPNFPAVGFLLAVKSGGDHRWKLALKLEDESQPRPKEDWFRLICVGPCCAKSRIGSSDDIRSYFHDHVRDICLAAGVKVLLTRNAGGWNDWFGPMMGVGLAEGNRIFQQAEAFYPGTDVSVIFPFVDFTASIFSHGCEKVEDTPMHDEDIAAEFTNLIVEQRNSSK